MMPKLVHMAIWFPIKVWWIVLALGSTRDPVANITAMIVVPKDPEYCWRVLKIALASPICDLSTSCKPNVNELLNIKLKPIM